MVVVPAAEAEMRSLPKFTPSGERLLGSECQACRARSWPGRSRCERCGSTQLAAVELATTGSIKSYTTVWVARPGLEPPYVLCQVDLDDGVRLHGHLRGLPDDPPPLPLAARLVVASDPNAVPRFWFELVEG